MDIQQQEDLAQNQQQQHNPALSKGNIEDKIVRTFQHINISSPIPNHNENKLTTNNHNNNNTNSGGLIHGDGFKKLRSGKTTISRGHVTTHAHATTYLQQFQVNKNHDHMKKKKTLMSCPNCGRVFRTLKLYKSHVIRDDPEEYRRLLSLLRMFDSSITTNNDSSSSTTVSGTMKKDVDEEKLCNAINDLII